MWGLGIARRKQPSSGSSFHYSFGLLPRPQRQGIEALYAFCRRVDDVADEGSGDQASAVADLQHYREELDRCYNGTPSVPVTRELQRTIRCYRIPRSPLDAILEGVEMDLTKARYANFRELRGYCYRVASAVGIVCTSIFECQHPASHDYAVDLGIALQLTNILRDLRADALRGRIYVPLDEIQAFGYSEGEMLSGERNEAFLALMRYQVDRADRHFDTAGSLLPDSDRKKLLAAEVMGAIYRRLLRRIEADGFRVFEHRIRVPRLTQLSLALRAWVTGRVGG